MKKKTKIALITLGVLLLGMCTFTGVDFFEPELYPYDYLRRAKKVSLKEKPEQVTEKSLEEQYCSFVQPAEHRSFIEGEFVPFSVHGKNSALRAVMSCADIIGLDEASELRYSDWGEGFLGFRGFLSGIKFFTFYQFYNGYPVLQTQIFVMTARFGKPQELDAAVYNDFPADLPTEAKITAEEATRIAALHDMNEPLPEWKPFLAVVFDKNDRAALAWVILIGAEPVFVDSADGTVIEVYDGEEYYLDYYNYID